MSYEILEFDIVHPPELVKLPSTAKGIAVILRQHGRPIDFWLEAITATQVFSADKLAGMVRSRRSQVDFELDNHPSIEQESSVCCRPSLSVAICTRDRLELVTACVNSVSAQVDSTDVEKSLAEIIVVDNAPSNDHTRLAVASLPNVRYICEPRAGLNFARNRAFAEACGDWVAYIDDDVVVDSGWAQGLLKAVIDNPDAGAVTGQILPLELATEAQILFERRGGFRREFSRMRYDRHWQGDALYPCRAGIFGNGANMAFRRDVLQQLGGFDEALDTGPNLPGGGDLDIFYRVIRTGYPLVYDPDYLVFHKHRRDMVGLQKQYQDSWGKAAMAFSGKCFRTDSSNRPRVMLFIVWWFLHEMWQILKSTLGRHAIPASMLMSELKGGFAGLFGGYSRSLERVQRIRQKYS